MLHRNKRADRLVEDVEQLRQDLAKRDEAQQAQSQLHHDEMLKQAMGLKAMEER